jgi:hypothetical protein
VSILTPGQPDLAQQTRSSAKACILRCTAGVVLYSMTAEKARLDPVAGAANLNTLQWGWFALGNLVADLNVGWMYHRTPRLPPPVKRVAAVTQG